MSRIEELLKEFCPDGVEYKTLGDVAELARGNGMPKADLTDIGVGAIHYGQIYTHYGTWANSTISFVNQEKASRLVKVNPGDLIVTNTSENIEDVCKTVAWLGSSRIVTGGHATVIRHHMNPKYLSYWFQSPEFFNQKKRFATGTKVIDVSAKQLAKIRVPVPPLPVQEEIVRILDSFTSLKAELEAELEARKKQYEYYRAELLSNYEDTVMRLGDVFDMGAGTHISASVISDTPNETQCYPCFGGNGIRGYVDKFTHNNDAVFIGRQGALCGNVHRTSGKFYATEHAVVVTPKIKVDMAWAFHKLTQMDLNQFKTKSAQPGLAVVRIKELTFTLPPLSEQHRIVSILDKFDSLVNDLSSGLPAEIAARRKQYEYYRDRLLTFKELTV